jgi:hypothetical protein
MVAIISRGQRRKSERGVLLFGVDLKDAREELFVRMVCDGLALGVAYARAGFTSRAHDAPSILFALPRCQERANAILDARRTTGVVTLGEVTDMLQRVFAGAHSEGEYSAAHNAAFSLARLYGHVTDRATLEVIRRPSRDPDAPSEQALSSWVEALPALAGPGPAALGGPSFVRLSEGGPGPEPAELPPHPDAPAVPLGPEPQNPSDIKDLQDMDQGPVFGPSGPGPLDWEKLNDIKGLEGRARGRTENGAPSSPVTVTPTKRGRSGLLGPGPIKKRVLTPRQVPVPKRGKVKIPSAKDLFG